ncbi:MAG: ABC transporter permease [Bacilli bacterium]
MKSKLNYLIGISLNRKIKTKWFLIANIVLGFVIICLLNIGSIITLFGGDFDNIQKVYVIDNTNETYNLFETEFKKTTTVLYGKDKSKYELHKYDNGIEEAKKILNSKADKNSIILVFNNSSTNVIDVSMITKEYMDMVDTQLLTSSLNNTKIVLALSKTKIPVEEINKIYNAIEIERIYLDESKNNADENMDMIMSTVFPILILPFFMLTLFLVQMIGAEVNDEKTTRSMEIIISNVSPKTHFLAKVIAGNLFVILQGLLLILFALIGIGIKNLIGGSSITSSVGNEIGTVINNVLASDIGKSLGYIIPLALILMLLTFVAYSLLAGILASMTTNIEDFQQLQTPIVVISLIGYYLAMMAGLFKGALFIKILSFIPLLSAILSPSLLVLGQIGIFEVIVSIILMLIFNYLLIKYGLKIYKVGILNYSSKDLWKKMFKAIKE